MLRLLPRLRVRKRNLSQKPPLKRAKRPKAYRGVDEVVPHKRRGEEESEGEDEAEVEAIVGKAMRDGVVHYVVRWKGYGEGDDTEQPAESLRHCQELVDAYERENGDETMYEPERIIKSVKRRGKVHYQVRWKGFGADVIGQGHLPLVWPLALTREGWRERPSAQLTVTIRVREDRTVREEIL